MIMISVRGISDENALVARECEDGSACVGTFSPGSSGY
jgi:hypothetical protein